MMGKEDEETNEEAEGIGMAGDKGFWITNKSVFGNEEAIRIVPVDEEVGVLVGLDGGNPAIVTRRIHASAEGRRFVAWQRGFAEVADDASVPGQVVIKSARFARGIWHRDQDGKWARGLVRMCLRRRPRMVISAVLAATRHMMATPSRSTSSPSSTSASSESDYAPEGGAACLIPVT